MENNLQEDKMWQDAMSGLMAWDVFQKKQAEKYLLKKSSFCEEFKELRWYERWFYWVKTFICLKLNLTGGSYLNDAINTHCWDESSCGTQDGTYYSWYGCWVEMGLFKNWKVQVASDGT